MKLYNDLKLRFEEPLWLRNTEFCLIDSILENHPELVEILKEDIVGNESPGNFGRKDTPSVEQILRAAIFKEMKGYDYRELEFAQYDSRICEAFIKLEGREPFSFQTFQKYISRIKAESLQRLLVEVNKLAIDEGLEDIKSLTMDTTEVKTLRHKILREL